MKFLNLKLIKFIKKKVTQLENNLCSGGGGECFIGPPSGAAIALIHLFLFTLYCKSLSVVYSLYFAWSFARYVRDYELSYSLYSCTGSQILRYDVWLMITKIFLRYFTRTYTSVWQYIIPYPIPIWKLNMIIDNCFSSYMHCVWIEWLIPRSVFCRDKYVKLCNTYKLQIHFGSRVKAYIQ